MSTSRLTLLGIGALLAVSLSIPAYAQKLAPTPKKAPRTPVKSRTLSRKDARRMPVSRILTGKAIVLDTQRIRLKGFDLRLFGIVPPKMNTPLGPQARTVLDSLAQGPVSCQIKDRERSGQYLATCANESNSDFGIELLRRGLAVAARSTLAPTKLAGPYLASESAAQKQKLGVWQKRIPIAASAASIKQAAVEADSAKREVERLLDEKKEAQARAKALRDVTGRAQASEKDMQDPAQTFTAYVELDLEEIPVPQVKPIEVELHTMVSVPVIAKEKLVLTEEELKPTTIVSLGPSKTDGNIQAVTTEVSTSSGQATSWLELNQIFATGLLFLLSSFVLAGSHLLWRRSETQNELRSMAAALRGELMSARAISKTRLAKWRNIKENEVAIWPRIRVMVFQAYLSKLGLLGADLSRQLASIYGQASDFASYYNQQKDQKDLTAKQQALQTLLDHIEEVLPRLSAIEVSGQRPKQQEQVSVKSSLLSHLPKKVIPPTDGGTAASITSQEVKKTPIKNSRIKAAKKLADIKKELLKDRGQGKIIKAKPSPLKQQKEKIKDAMKSVRNSIDNATEKAGRRLAELHATPSSTESYIPDYANLTEEEVTALSEDNFDDFVTDKRTQRAK